jgi:hypothetical protein
MVVTMAKVIILSVAIPGTLLTLVFATQGQWKAIGAIWSMFAVIGAFLAVLFALIMAVVFRNRIHVRYTITETGIVMETIDISVRRANRVAIIVGALAGRPQLAGAGLIGASREREAVQWNGAFKAILDDHAQTVTLANAWRRLMVVQCTPENYSAVAALVRESMAKKRTAMRVPGRSPLIGYLGWTAAVTVACVPSFLVVKDFEVSLFLPILLLCFAIATVWLVPLFAYVIWGASGLIVGSIVLDALVVRESYFNRNEHYAHWTVWSGNDWALLVLEALSLAFLGWFAMRALRGRVRVALVADDADRGG